MHKTVICTVYIISTGINSVYYRENINLSPLSKDKTRRDSSLTLMICSYTVIKAVFMYFCV